MSTCMRCGKEIADGSSFCNECKGIVNPVENVQPTYVQQYQQVNPVQPNPVQPPVQPNPAQQQYAPPPPPQQPNMSYQQPNTNYQQPYQQPGMNYQQPPMGYQQPYMGYPQPEQQKKTYVGLICGIIGIVFSFLFALVGHAASITGIVFGVKEKKTQDNSAGLIVSIIGEVLSVISSLIGIVTMLGFVL